MAPKKSGKAGGGEGGAKPTGARRARARREVTRKSTTHASDEASDTRTDDGLSAGERDTEPGRESAAADDDDVIVGEIAEAPPPEEGDDEAAPAGRAAIEPEERGVGRFDPLAAYLSEIQRHPVLPAEEQHDLAVKFTQSGDVGAAAKLVTSNLRLVVKIAYEYRRAYRNLMDLVQEGNIGLMQAVKRYDPYRGVKLSSYAAWWIRAYILRFILNNWRLVKLGTTQAQRKLFFNLNKEKQKLLAMGVNPSAEELAKRLDVEESEVVEMDRRMASNDMSLNAPVGDGDGRSMSHIDLLPAGGVGQDDSLSSEELGGMVRERLDQFAKTLKGKDVTIFHERLMAEDPVTLQEIGDKFGISRERVRQLEKRMQDRLREYLREELGDAIQFG